MFGTNQMSLFKTNSTTILTLDNILSLPPRTSEDSTKVDGRGEELLDLCKAFNLVIINGRKTGDPFGKITYQ